MAKNRIKRPDPSDHPDAEWTLTTLVRMLSASPSEEPLTEAETCEAI